MKNMTLEITELINFQLDKSKTNFLKKSISYSGAKCWNNLPNEIKAKEMTMGQFKTFLTRKRQYLLVIFMCAYNILYIFS